MLSQDEYIKKGDKYCPRCKKEEGVIEYSEFDLCDAWVILSCPSCGLEWRENYSLSEYEVTDDESL